MLNIHWTPGDTGAGHVTGYVIEARPSGTSLKTHSFVCVFIYFLNEKTDYISVLPS